MADKTPITIAYGDGIGPEIMAAVLRILEGAGAQLDLREIEIGEKVYARGISAGIEPSAWDTLLETKVFLKAPITTPQGGGFKSLNVTARKTLGLYANVRPAVSYAPFIDTKAPDMDVVVVRENEEDTYAGIEHRQSEQVFQCLKLISRPGCEKIVRYAFEYARANGRKKVTCMTKDNIMKMTDGVFHKVFDEIAPEYPDIENEHWIVDIGTAKLADTPELFDVVVTLNLYGDIISDMTAQIAGSVGLAGSANIGERAAMFEAIHGSAPRRAGQNVANPSGLLHGAILMLIHIGQPEVAEKVHNAWLKTIEDGVHTYDIFQEGKSTEKVGTQEFAEAVVARIGQRPEKLKAVTYVKADTSGAYKGPITTALKSPKQEIIGVDMFVQRAGVTPDEMGAFMQQFEADGLTLGMLSNRGVKVWPDGSAATGIVDHWRCRYYADNPVDQQVVLRLMQRANEGGAYWNHIELLQTFDGDRAFSLGQGE
ncbi:MAG: NADP-dependent isocitrate dehydrogenase [bacterium]|nr:NADP-dependent isocitrate dehydrogenase [bacterium]